MPPFLSGFQSAIAANSLLFFQRLWAASLILLIAVTWPLWFHQPAVDAYPAIPLLGVDVAIPAVLYPLATVVLIAGLLTVVVRVGRYGPAAWWLVFTALLVSFLIDQHRLQPWAYQAAIYAVIFAAVTGPTARRCLIAVAASIYIYSAIGKLDYQFAHTVGQDFLAVLFRPLGGVPDGWDESTRATVALIFPWFEGTAGVGLLIPAGRRIAGFAVLIIHTALIGILGPWGLDHSNGVLVWNAALWLQAYLLFVRRDDGCAPSGGNHRELSPSYLGRVGGWFARGIVIIALAAPLLERFGYWDHWTSWALYAPHSSRAEIELHRSASEFVPPGLFQDDDGGPWRTLDIARWSLSSRKVPVYPQARYQLSLAAKLAERHQLDDDIRARVGGISDRWTGARRWARLLGRPEIDRERQRYWLSADHK